MTGQGRRRPARMSAYASASSHLALLSADGITGTGASDPLIWLRLARCPC